jgi:hypothetical protein
MILIRVAATVKFRPFALLLHCITCDYADFLFVTATILPQSYRANHSVETRENVGFLRNSCFRTGHGIDRVSPHFGDSQER